MSKRGVLLTVIVAGSVALFALGCLLIVGIPMDQDAFRRHVTEDAVQVSASGIAQERRAGRSPSPADVDGLLATWINGSVIHGGFDRNAKPTLR